MASVQKQIDQAFANFASELVEIIRAVVAEAIAESQPAASQPAPSRPAARQAARTAAPAAPAGRKRGRPASAEQGDIETRILRTLEVALRNLSATEIQERLRAEAGPVRYAIKKLKAEGQIVQEGERRGARYRIGRTR